MLPLWSFAAWERKGFLQRMIENARNLSRSCDKEEKYRLQVFVGWENKCKFATWESAVLDSSP